MSDWSGLAPITPRNVVPDPSLLVMRHCVGDPITAEDMAPYHYQAADQVDGDYILYLDCEWNVQASLEHPRPHGGGNGKVCRRVHTSGSHTESCRIGD